MDKAVLSNPDIDALLAWRDEHKELVRSAPCPLKAIDIYCKDQEINIRGVRKSALEMTLHFAFRGKPRGRLDWFLRPDGKWALAKDTLAVPDGIHTDVRQSILTIYASLMALMVYGNEGRQAQLPLLDGLPLPQGPAPARERTDTPGQGRKKAKSSGFTYILRRSKDGSIRTAIQGSRTSPQGVFSVRGHYRHYKSGKVVWVSEYKKGTGKNRKKTYRIGGAIE